MWKAIKNISNALVDITVVGGKEVKHQIDKANNYSDSMTDKMAARAAKLRLEYEAKYAPVQKEQEESTKVITNN